MLSHKIVGIYKVAFVDQEFLPAHFRGCRYSGKNPVLLRTEKGFVFRKSGGMVRVGIGQREYEPASLEWMPDAKYPGIGVEICAGRISKIHAEPHKTQFREITGLLDVHAEIVSDAAKLRKTAVVSLATKEEIDAYQLKVEDDRLEGLDTDEFRSAVVDLAFLSHKNFAPFEIWRDEETQLRFAFVELNESGRAKPPEKGNWVRVGVYYPKVQS